MKLPAPMRRRRRARPEEALQKTVAAFLDVALPADALWSSIDHATRSAFEGAMKKARGVKPGLADILIVFGGIAHMIELKAPKGGISDNQQFIRDALRRAGGKWGEARALEDVMNLLAVWGIPTSAHLAVAAARKIA